MFAGQHDAAVDFAEILVVPFVQGCFCFWTDAQREQHYQNLCEIDGRIVLAGEHASYLAAWQEGAVTSALDAIGRPHKKMVAHA